MATLAKVVGGMDSVRACRVLLQFISLRESRKANRRFDVARAVSQGARFPKASFPPVVAGPPPGAEASQLPLRPSSNAAILLRGSITGQPPFVLCKRVVGSAGTISTSHLATQQVTWKRNTSRSLARAGCLQGGCRKAHATQIRTKLAWLKLSAPHGSRGRLLLALPHISEIPKRGRTDGFIWSSQIRAQADVALGQQPFERRMLS